MSVDPLAVVELRCLCEEISGVASHDIRNKLAGVRQATYFLKTRFEPLPQYGEDPRIARFFDIVGMQIEEADTLLSHADALARLYAPGEGPARSSDIVTLALAGVREPVVHVAVEDAAISADGPHLAYGLRCLVQNAVEASPTPGSVTITGRVRDDHYALSVTDAGPGVEPKDLRRLAERFYTTKPGHRGLGLMIARRIATRYGGALTALPRTIGASLELSMRRAVEAAK